MSERPKISVLMPVYNTKEEYLREAVESILNQTFSDFEFIIINDGSTNNAKDVILSYSDPRIKYFEQENQGISATTNRMLDMAQGEYIAMMDSDDISLKDRLQLQLNYLETHSDIDIVSGCYRTMHDNKDCITQNKTLYVKYLDLLRDNPIPGAVSFIRNDFIKKNKLHFDETYNCVQDYKFWADAIRFTSQIPVLQEVVYLYRILPNSNSHNNSQYTKEQCERVRQGMLDFLTNDKDLKKKVYKLIQNNIKYSPLEKIFSMKNFYINNKKYKVINFIGIKITV